jgi:hypothetical protein
MEVGFNHTTGPTFFSFRHAGKTSLGYTHGGFLVAYGCPWFRGSPTLPYITGM